jgi:hypothetical protein
VKSSEKIDKLCEAMVKAQAEAKAPPLDAVNPHFKNRYASLGAVRDAIVPVFNRHGLYLMQSPGTSERGPALTTLIFHSSGQWLELEPLSLPVQRQDAQGYGSALTYARRYALLAVAGVVADEDDDANDASRPAKAPREQGRPAEGPKEAAPVPLASIPQREALVELKAQARMSDEAFVNTMEVAFGCKKTKDLTSAQAEKFAEMLRRQLPRRPQELAGSGSAGTGPYGPAAGGR